MAVALQFIEGLDPLISRGRALVLRRPVGENLVIVVPSPERTKGRVVFQPLAFLLAEFLELPHPRALRLLKIAERSGEKFMFESLDLRVFHFAFAQ